MASTVLLLLVSAGCTPWRDYIRNGFKVGPNYCKPDAPVAQHWIDEVDIRTRQGEDLSKWWTVFNDPKLNYLIHHAYRQNLTLKEAGYRVLMARANLAIAQGQIFPQTQTMSGSYSRNASSSNPPPFGLTTYSDSWGYGFNLGWELDFWGRLRRAIAQADDNLDASVEDYDDVLVTLLGDVATNYVTLRTLQQRIEYVRQNVKLQTGVFNYIALRAEVGFKNYSLDFEQTKANLRQVEAAIPQLEISLRQTENALCVLLGMPPEDIAELVGTGPIPTAPPEVVIGIPADLLRRRPDVRRAERLAAAQAEQIGITQAQLYPTFALGGSLGYQAKTFNALFSENAFRGDFGPSFSWNILNYGRIVNNVRFQEANFQQLVVAYQQTVLNADQEVENGLVSFLRSQKRATLLDESVDAATKAVNIVITQLDEGAVDFNRYATIAQSLVTQQDSDAQAYGDIARGLISVYAALGGGWEIRLSNEAPPALPPSTPPETPKEGDKGDVSFPTEKGNGPKETIPRPSNEPMNLRNDADAPSDATSAPAMQNPGAAPNSADQK